MLPKERQIHIIQKITKLRNCSIIDLQKELNISKSTLYRDIDILEKENYIKRVYGGIEVIDKVKSEHNFFIRLRQNVQQKIAIARKAIEYIQPNDTIFIDESTTSYYLAKELLKLSKENITIITNSSIISQEYLTEKSTNIIITGGLLNKDFNCYTGTLTEDFITNFIASKFIFSCFSFSPDKGVLDGYIPEIIRVKKMMMEIASQRICLIDSSKFNKSGTANWLSLKEIDLLITDDKVDEKIIRALQRNKVNFKIASVI